MSMVFSVHTAALALLLGTTAVAQVGGSYTTFAAGCPGTLGIPTLRASRPALNSTLEINVDNVPGLVPLFFGVSNSVWVGGPLPFNFGFLGAAGCQLLVSTDITLSLVAVSGTARVLLSIPNAPTLIGQTFYNQALPIDPGANVLGLTASDGGCGTIGVAGAGGVAINNVSNRTPAAGQSVVMTGAGFNQWPPCVGPGFFPTGSPVGGKLTLVAANVPNPGMPFTLDAANFTAFTFLGPGVTGGQPFVQVPGVAIPATTIGGVGTFNAGFPGGQGIPMTIQPAPVQPKQLPVTIDTLGRMCIDFTGTTWTGTEKLEIEFHFDITPAACHCDFFATTINFTQAGTAAQCAATAGIWITLQLAIDPRCGGISISVSGNSVYLIAPGGGKFTNLHPFTHVAIK